MSVYCKQSVIDTFRAVGVFDDITDDELWAYIKRDVEAQVREKNHNMTDLDDEDVLVAIAEGMSPHA
jgi:hypothetical protein